MKKHFTLSLLLIGVCQVIAQSPVHYKFAKQEQAYAVAMQLLNRPTTIAAKTTLTKERLIGSRYSTNNFRPMLNIYDSSVYKYSGNNGSQFDLNALQYNFPSTQFDYDLPMVDEHGYHVTAPEVMCDTAIGKNAGNLGHLVLANTTISGYDMNGMLVSYSSVNIDTSYTPSISYYNTYDGAGNVTASISFNTHNGTTWDTSGERYFAYNGSGQLLADSNYSKSGSTWYVSNKVTYAYDGSGHINHIQQYTSKSPIALLKYTGKIDLTYYTDGKLETIYTSKDTGTGMYLNYADTFGYAAGYNYFNFYESYGYTDSGWKPVSSTTKHINAAGVPDTVYKSELIYFFDTTGALLGSQYLYFKDIITYNVHNDPVRYVDYIDWGSGYSDNSDQHFYYEPATNIASTLLEFHVITYPNPVKENIYVVPGENARNKRVNIQLCNAEGRLLRSMQVVWQGQPIQMSVAELASGVYYISVCDTSGDKSTEKIIKE